MYIWSIVVDDTPVRMVQVQEHARWHLKHLQLRCVLAEYVEVDKWRRCRWTLEVGGCAAFCQDDKPAIVRRDWQAKPWQQPRELCIFVHAEELLGSVFCSRDVSFCIPLPLLFAKLDVQQNCAAACPPAACPPAACQLTTSLGMSLECLPDPAPRLDELTMEDTPPAHKPKSADKDVRKVHEDFQARRPPTPPPRRVPQFDEEEDEEACLATDGEHTGRHNNILACTLL